MKKFFSLVLALVMALSLTTIAWGAVAATDAAKIGDTGYATLADAVTAATDGDEIVLLKDVADGVGIVIDKKLTIDFGGYTYTFASNPVGSTGTESQGFQILKAADAVTLKNGTLTSKAGSGVKMLVNNYCDLKLVNMTADGTNLDPAFYGNPPVAGPRYTMSNNSGAVVIENTTLTAAAADGVAFDTCKSGNYTVPTVTVKGTSVINGTVEAAGGKLVVEAGTFNGEIAVTDTDDVSITGGTFSTLPDESLLADGYTFVGNTVTVPEKKATSYEGLYARTADMASTAHTIPGIEIIVTPAKAPKYNKTTGMLDYPGEVEHVNITGWGGDYVFVNSTDDADVVLYKDEAGKQIRFRLAAVNTPEYAEGALFTNFGDKCGQVDYDGYDKEDVYFTGKGDVNEGIYVADEDGLLNVMYGGKLVAVSPINLTYTDDAVQHTPVMTNKNGETIAVECGACGLDAVKVANVLLLPKGAEQITGTLSGVWYWPTATTTPSTDKTVNSADTFDAGIAMYVGMSVMAAAGSVVVLKKRED